MSLYAAYRTDVSPALLRERCPASPVQGPGWLTGWRLTFAVGNEEDLMAEFEGGVDASFGAILSGDVPGACATVVQDPNSSVFVMLYDVSPADEEVLQLWEGASYRKLKIRVETLEGSVMAWTFVYDGYEGGLPDASYLGELSNAAENAGAPGDYVNELRHRPCRSNPS